MQLSEIKPHNGDDNLLEDLSARLLILTEDDIIGVVVDADTSPSGRWQGIRQRLVDAGYRSLPRNPAPAGIVLDALPDLFLPKIGIWIMPNNRNEGNLEDFLRFLVPQGDDLIDYAQLCVGGLPRRPFDEQDESKAILHTWLAWQKEPGRPYGTAITARYLNLDVPEADVLVSWLQRLFASPDTSA